MDNFTCYNDLNDESQIFLIKEEDNYSVNYKSENEDDQVDKVYVTEFIEVNPKMPAVIGKKEIEKEEEPYYENEQHLINVMKKMEISATLEEESKKFQAQFSQLEEDCSDDSAVLEETSTSNNYKDQIWTETFSGARNDIGEASQENGILRCSECDFKTEISGFLKQHMRSHEKNNSIYNYSQLPYSDFNNDVSVYEDENPLKCFECNFECKNKHSLKKHSLIHSNVKNFKCDQCSYECNYKASLKTHSLSHANIKLHKCPHCVYQTNIKDNLNSHLATHNDERPYKCTKCPFEFKLKQSLRRHVSTVHSTKMIFKCNECSYECKRKDHLVSHLLVHSNVKLFSCNIELCNYKCNSKSNLSVHMLNHTNSSKLYKCTHCNYDTNCKYKLKLHFLKHTNPKSFRCSHCTYKCNQKSDLKVHLLTHLKTKLYKCTNCTYECNTKSSLKSHLLRHLPKKIFNCVHCTFGTNYKHSLKTHLRVHDETKTQVNNDSRIQENIKIKESYED